MHSECGGLCMGTLCCGVWPVARHAETELPLYGLWKHLNDKEDHITVEPTAQIQYETNGKYTDTWIYFSTLIFDWTLYY